MKKAIIISTVLVSMLVFVVWVLQPEPPARNALVEPTTVRPPDFVVSPDVTATLDSDQIQNAYTGFLNSTIPEDAEMPWITFTGAPELALADFFTAMEVTMPVELERMLRPSDWMVYRCTDNNALVLSTLLRLMPDYPGNIYDDQLALLDQWETTMLADLRTVLYPETYYSRRPGQASGFVKNLEKQTVDLYQSEVSLPDGSKADFMYLIVGDELLFGTDEACLLEVQEFLFDTSA